MAKAYDGAVTNVLGSQIAEMVGLDPKSIRSIRIDLTAGDAAQLSIEYFLSVKESEDLARFVGEYELVRRG